MTQGQPTEDIHFMLVTNPRKQTGTEQWEERTQYSVFILRPRRQLKDLVIAPDIVDCSTIAKIIGVIFNNSLSMVQHVTAVRKSSFFIYAIFLRFAILFLTIQAKL